jgi:hypothetical protein
MEPGWREQVSGGMALQDKGHLVPDPFLSLPVCLSCQSLSSSTPPHPSAMMLCFTQGQRQWNGATRD